MVVGGEAPKKYHPFFAPHLQKDCISERLAKHGVLITPSEGSTPKIEAFGITTDDNTAKNASNPEARDAPHDFNRDCKFDQLSDYKAYRETQNEYATAKEDQMQSDQQRCHRKDSSLSDDEIEVIEVRTSCKKLRPIRKTASWPHAKKANSSLQRASSSFHAPQLCTILDLPLVTNGFETVRSQERWREVRKAQLQSMRLRDVAVARWPTKEEHGQWVQGREVSTTDSDASRACRWEKRSGRPVVTKEYDAFDGMLTGVPSLHKQLNEDAMPSVRLLCGGPSVEVPFFASHPMLDRLAIQLRNQSKDIRRPNPRDGELWTVKYAPQKASEVLGLTSGSSALLLKSWLKVMAIGNAPNSKKRSHHRQHHRFEEARRRKYNFSKGLNGFIVEDEDDGSNDEDSLEYFSTSSNESITKRNYPILPNHSNLILLCGPIGSGKTSAVHAVAKELGYDVFEVNPGLGKRGAKDLDRYVGNIGDNYMVRFASFGTTKSVPSMHDTKEEGYSEQSRSDMPTLIDSSLNTAMRKGQSLILFEEVDVLYRDEKDFWAGLSNLARQSRRPIIMTCVDPGYVPLSLLGLQKVRFARKAPVMEWLPFAAPEISQALPFLQLVAQCERTHTDNAVAQHLLINHSTADRKSELATCIVPGISLVPSPTGVDKFPDLRQCLFQLQWECLRDPLPSKLKGTLTDVSALKEEANPSLELSALVMTQETASFADAFISTGMSGSFEEDEEQEDVTSAELADNIAEYLPCFTRSYLRNITSFSYSTRENVAKSIYNIVHSQRSRTQFDPAEANRMALKIRETRLAYSSFATKLISHEDTGSIVPALLLTNPDVFTEYLPAIRDITRADDMHELIGDKIENETSNLTSRGSRRSTRLGGTIYKRRIRWTDSELDLLRASGFA